MGKSKQNTAKIKPHRFLFIVLILLLPTQLGRHWWPEWSYVLGLRVDYLSPTIYLTDILVAGILGLWGWEKTKNQKPKTKNTYKKLKNLIFPASIFLFLLVSCFFAQNQGVALYKFIKIIEFTLFGFYIAKNHYQLSTISYQLSLGIIYSSLIAIVQFLKQSSLNGLFWWLGERTFDISTPGIAKAIISGRLILRPYATFSHPNVLAGFVLVSLTLILIHNTQYAKRKIKSQNTFKKILWWLAVVLGIVAILISFSRSAWLIGLAVGLWVVGCGLWEKTKKKKILLITTSSLLITSFTLLLVFNLPFSTSEAFSQRFQLAKAAISMIKESPLIGVGLNNFIVRLLEFWQIPENIRLFQPVHNIYLLVAAETGLVGLLIFLWFLILAYKRLLNCYIAKLPLLISLSVTLLLGFTDHYFLTLQQTQLLLAVVLGLSWGSAVYFSNNPEDKAVMGSFKGLKV